MGETEDRDQIAREDAAVVAEGDSWKECESRYADKEVEVDELSGKLAALRADSCTATCQPSHFPAVSPPGNGSA